MQNVHEIPNRIIEVIKKRGPSLPIQIAKEINISTLFVSAFLSELSDNRRIKISSLKVGGSPLYYIEGQEEQLERFHTYMHPKEIEVFHLLKKNKILKDRELEPALRTAIQSIKDFASSFNRDNETYWRHILVPNHEIELLFTPNIIKEINKTQINIEQDTISGTLTIIEDKPLEKSSSFIEQTNLSQIEKKEIKPEKIEKNLLLEKMNQKFNELNSFNNPLVKKPVEKPKKEKPKSEFVEKVIRYLQEKGFKILEEKEHRSKEYLCIAELDTILGPIAFLTLAKDKKLVSDEDLIKLLSDAQSIPLPALFLAPGELNKKAKEYLQKYYSIIKTKKLFE